VRVGAGAAHRYRGRTGAAHSHRAPTPSAATVHPAPSASTAHPHRTAPRTVASGPHRASAARTVASGPLRIRAVQRPPLPAVPAYLLCSVPSASGSSCSAVAAACQPVSPGVRALRRKAEVSRWISATRAGLSSVVAAAS
jgi:hypothetical protein